MMLKTPSEEEILKMQEQQERAVVNAGREVYSDLDKVVTQFAARLDSALLELERGNVSRSRAEQILELQTLADGLEEALIDAGFYDTLERFSTKLYEMEPVALQYYELYDLPPSKIGIDVEVLDAWVKYSADGLTDITDRKLIQPMRSALLNASVGNVSQKEVTAEVKAIMDQEGITTKAGEPFTDAQLETYVEDSMRRMQRQVGLEAANELDMQIVQFIGPSDKVTSEQCQWLLSQAPHGAPGFWLQSEVKTGMHPKLKENPLVAGGHFNCRHDFFPVSVTYAKQRGWTGPGSDDVAEAVADG
jgi:hypothetical protein